MLTATLPNTAYEAGLTGAGLTRICGVDEVGRGCLAGPIMAAAVVLPAIDTIAQDQDFWRMVNDSKVISARKRELLAVGIRERVAAWSVAAIDVPELDAVGVGPANRMVMERAVMGLSSAPEVLLIDAMTIDLGLPQLGIIDGDARSLAIAAASILAKVTRDARMVAAEAEYPGYGFAQHKGYGTAAHLAALSALGPTEMHRRTFAPVARAWEVWHGRATGE